MMQEKQATPYVGPRAFSRGQKLYGRDWEVAELRDLLVARRIVLLHAPSGAGKTSLIQAGLIPALDEDPVDVLPVIRVNAEPPAEAGDAAAGLNRYTLSAIASLEEEQDEGERLLADELAELDLAGYLDRRREVAGAAGRPGEADTELLIFDQFEEVLTADPTDVEAKAAFFVQLGAALRDPSRSALFVMREDYVASLDPYLRPLPQLLSNRFRIDRLDVNAALPAIREPARLWGVDFTEAAARGLIDDLRRVRVQGLDGKLEEQLGPHVEPVQLQVVCEMLWRTPRPNPEQITEEDVESLGSVDDALAAYYAGEVATVAAKAGLAERTIRDWFDSQLITEQGFRGQVEQGVGKSRGLENEAIWQLVDAYLVRAERRRGVTWFELAHDRLIDPVRGDNAIWREKNLPAWQRRALVWNRMGRSKGLLLEVEETAEAERWLASHPRVVLTKSELEFLDGSRELRDRAERERARDAERHTNLAELGWGVIFAWQDRERVAELKDALGELLEHRRAEAGERYREFTGGSAYRPGEEAVKFLERHGMGPGTVDPDKVPYYLLLVGDPETIPFEFQYTMDIHHAVGRIHFETLEEYGRYARSVVMAETGLNLARRAAFFGVQNLDDRATELSAQKMVGPLAQKMAQDQEGWVVRAVLGEETTKARLARLLGGEETPTLLFAAGHGMAWPPGHERQATAQGALLCQDWPGSKAWQKPIPADFYFGSEDVADEARLLGLIAFMWNDYSAGTPEVEDFAEQAFREPQRLAPKASLASLPRRLLAHPQGGALAVIGHVERNWGYSFMWERAGTQLGVFEETLRRLMDGHTVGSAMERFNQRYAMLASLLAETLRRVSFGENVGDYELAGMWTAAIDARNYVVIGDPAVRLPVGDGPRPDRRPVIEPVAAEQPVAEEALVAKGGLDVTLRPTELVIFNGINAATGGYLLPPMTVEQLAMFVRGQALDAATDTSLRRWLGALTKMSHS